MWTEIQTVIKGGIQAFETGKPLTQEYLAVGKRGSKLGNDEGVRMVSYEMYRRSHKEDNGILIG